MGRRRKREKKQRKRRRHAWWRKTVSAEQVSEDEAKELGEDMGVLLERDELK